MTIGYPVLEQEQRLTSCSIFLRAEVLVMSISIFEHRRVIDEIVTAPGDMVTFKTQMERVLGGYKRNHSLCDPEL